MERRGKQNESVWDGILVRALRRRAAHKTVPYIERPPLDELLAEHKALKDENSDFVRYTSDFSSLSLGAAAVNTLVTADSYRPGVEDDFLRDYEVSVFRLTAERPPRMCKKGLHSVPLSFDYCGECKEFFDDVYFCRFCNTPTSKSLALKFLCRGRFSFASCDVHGRHAAERKGSKTLWTCDKMFRLVPSPDDLCNAAERYLRLEARRADRRGSLSAMTLAFDPPAPTASAPLEPRAALPPASPPPSTSAYSPSGEHVAPVAILLRGLAAFSSSCTGPGLHPGHSEVETAPYPSALTTYAPPQH